MLHANHHVSLKTLELELIKYFVSAKFTLYFLCHEKIHITIQFTVKRSKKLFFKPEIVLKYSYTFCVVLNACLCYFDQIERFIEYTLNDAKLVCSSLGS